MCASGGGRESLQNFLDGVVGKHVDFETRFLDQNQNFEEHYVDLGAIKFDIETEDDEEEKESE